MPKRSYDGTELDHSWQYFHERPALEEEAETVVYATDPDDAGEETTENVPAPERGPPEDVDGQTTVEDWAGWSV